MMSDKLKFIYFFSVLVYIGFIILNYVKDSKFFIIDNLVAIAILTVIYLFRNWLKISNLGFIFANIGLLVHNMGSFGLYKHTFFIFAYDNFVHLIGSFAAAYVIFNFISRKLHIRKGEEIKNSVVDEHKFIFIFLGISSVVMLGTIVEIVEFFGFVQFGSDIQLGGLLNPDAEGIGSAKDYIDTMSDILVNIIGSIIGVLTYYYLEYKKIY